MFTDVNWRIVFHPFGFTFVALLAPLAAYLLGGAVLTQMITCSLVAIVVLLGNIVYELRKG